MRKLLFLIILFAAFVTTSVVAQDAYPAICHTKSDLNVRTGAGTSYARIGYLKKGESVEVKYLAGPSNKPWGAINYRGKNGYVSMKYMVYDSPVVTAPAKTSVVKGKVGGFFARLGKIVRTVLIIIAVVLVLLFWEFIVEMAVYAGFFAAGGALIFFIFGGSAGTGAIFGLIAAALEGLRLLGGRLLLDVSDVWGVGIIRGFFLVAYYIISFPFYWLNQIEHMLVAPWRYLFRRNWVGDGAKPFLRVVTEVITVVMYIVTTPLRLANAIVYNILIHCVTGFYDLLFEVLVPSDSKEGAGNTWRWIMMFPWRFVKYPLWHGLLLAVESVVWTVVDIFIPARTLYHGTDLDACSSITADPYRNKYLRNTSLWTSGTFLASTHPDCSWAGRGVYFAINRRLASGYSDRASGSADPVMIACRVSVGRVISYGLTPDYVYRQTGDGGKHEELNKFGDAHGYTTGEWFNNRRHWEYCLFDWQNRYNHPWRIRPIYILNFRTGLAQHIKGGMQHWLFDKAVLNDIFGRY